MSRVNSLWFFGRILSHTEFGSSSSKLLPQLSTASRVFSTGGLSLASRRCADTEFRTQAIRHYQGQSGTIASRAALSPLQCQTHPADKAQTQWTSRIHWRLCQHRAYSKDRDGQGPDRVTNQNRHGASQTPKPDPKPGQGEPSNNPNAEPEAESLAASMSKYLPHLPHRPTKAELLAAATNFRQRMKVRFKWMSIRSMRPWNADEWGAFVSWIMLGHLVWVLVGTTTFFSLLILSINTVFAQGTYLLLSILLHVIDH